MVFEVTFDRVLDRYWCPTGGHLVFKVTFDRVIDRYWWPTMQRDIQSYCTSCDACQRRKTPHRRPSLPTGHVPVNRPFQRGDIDLVEYITVSQGCIIFRPSDTFCHTRSNPEHRSDYRSTYPCGQISFRVTRVVSFRHGQII